MKVYLVAVYSKYNGLRISFGVFKSEDEANSYADYWREEYNINLKIVTI